MIGKKVRKLRMLRDYSQEYMAKRLNMSQQAYSKLENDNTNVSLELLKQIAAVLEMAVEDLLSFDEKSVFNFFNNTYTQSHINTCSTNNYSIDSRLEELYRKQIELLEEKVSHLKSELEQTSKTKTKQ